MAIRASLTQLEGSLTNASRRRFACQGFLPASRAGTRAAAPASASVILDNADVISVEGVAEFCVIQLANGPLKVVCCLKFHNTHGTAPIPDNICVGRLHHLPEVVLQGVKEV